MNVLVETNGCPFDVEIERMIRLFVSPDVVKIVHADERAVHELVPDNDSTNVHIALSLTCATQDRLRANGECRWLNEAFSAVREVSIDPNATAARLRTQGKQAVLHVLHQLFEQATGTHQPWGILTGVRPTKLVHALSERGVHETDIAHRLEQDYLLSPDRARLLIEVAGRQRAVVPDLYVLNHEVSIYVGIPFCPSHCAYCTFPAYSMQDKAMYVDDFMAAMEREIRHAGNLLREFQIPVTTVYLGGGTPTSLRALEMERLMEMLKQYLPGSHRWREFTVEAGRPDTITPDRVRVMREHGVTRVSVNPQTFKASTLKSIGRGHTPDQVDHRFHHVRGAGFDNINMDVIIGLPGETVEDVRYTMDRIERLNPDAITVHTLSFKRTAEVKRHAGDYAIPDWSTASEMMRETVARLRTNGYHPYYVYRQRDILGNLENIGFARPGKESVYNISIMEERQTIVGVGGGAVTKLIGRDGTHYGRFANPREPKAYIDTIDSLIDKKDAVLRNALGSTNARVPL